jgi:GTP-binding protein YchF
MIAQVVRCFDDPGIIHVNNKVDPRSDMETVNTELALADLETLEKRRERLRHSLRVQARVEQKSAETALAVLDKLAPALEQAMPLRSVELTDDERAAIYDCHFMTAKPQIYVCNVDEETMRNMAGPQTPPAGGNPFVEMVRKQAEAEHAAMVAICGKFEAELLAIEEPEERRAFLEELGLKESGLSALIHAAYRLLGLRTFFTAGADECRAWTIHAGDTAPKAAGVIHSDFEKGFIKAEIYSYDDILRYGTEARIKEAGKYRVEGREYTVQDGDVVFFKFNV